MTKILIVDDDPGVRQALRELCQAEGLVCAESPDGADALEMVHTWSPDLILLDLCMPVVSGETVAEMLKGNENTRALPIVVLTGDGHDDTVVRLLDTGVEGYITKPFTPKPLLARIRSLLRSKEANDRLMDAFRTVEAIEREQLAQFHSLEDQVAQEDQELLAKPVRFYLHSLRPSDGPTHFWIGSTREELSSGTEFYLDGSGALVQNSRAIDARRLERLMKHHEHQTGRFWTDRAPLGLLGLLWKEPPAAHALAGVVEKGQWVVCSGFRRKIGRQDTRWLMSFAHQRTLFQKHVAQIRATEDAFVYTMLSLARAAEAFDEDTGGHILRVNEYSKTLAEEMGCDAAFVRQISVSAMMHDVGKIRIPLTILQKPDALTQEEFDIVQSHPLYGAQILGDSPKLAMAHAISLCHHENWDGTGYPGKLRQQEIPLSARIVKLADVYDALRSRRPYKDSESHEHAIRVMIEGDGRTLPSHFDPLALEAFLDIAPKMNVIYTYNQLACAA